MLVWIPEQPSLRAKTVRICYVATPENSEQSSIAPTTSYHISNDSIFIRLLQPSTYKDALVISWWRSLGIKILPILYEVTGAIENCSLFSGVARQVMWSHISPLATKGNGSIWTGTAIKHNTWGEFKSTKMVYCCFSLWQDIAKLMQRLDNMTCQGCCDGKQAVMITMHSRAKNAFPQIALSSQPETISH